MYYSNNDVRVEERPKPKIGPSELLVKVMASGICGTDVVEWYRRDRVPLVLGHEIAGEVVETGNSVKLYKAGDRVSVSHHVPCGECRYCLNDHHSACETLRKTSFDPVYKLPASVSYEEATFIEPLACAIRGQRLSWQRPGKGESAVVIGSGISGLLHIQLLKAKGFSKIIATDINDYRLKEALRFGADHAINAKEDVPLKVMDLNNGRLADFVILCAGARPAITQAIKSLDRGGAILIFASADEGFNLSLPMNDFFWRSERSQST
jgi:L-iditol 2-dehydrogenase